MVRALFDKGLDGHYPSMSRWLGARGNGWHEKEPQNFEADTVITGGDFCLIDEYGVRSNFADPPIDNSSDSDEMGDNNYGEAVINDE